MNLETIRDMLAWCAVIDIAILLVWWGCFATARGWMQGLHARWFPMSEERFVAIHYAGMAAFKIGMLVFHLIPYLALRIVG